MEVKSSYSLQEGVKVDEDKIVDIRINFYGICSENRYRIEETVKSFLYSVEGILNEESTKR